MKTLKALRIFSVFVSILGMTLILINWEAIFPRFFSPELLSIDCLFIVFVCFALLLSALGEFLVLKRGSDISGEIDSSRLFLSLSFWMFVVCFLLLLFTVKGPANLAPGNVRFLVIVAAFARVFSEMVSSRLKKKNERGVSGGF